MIVQPFGFNLKKAASAANIQYVGGFNETLSSGTSAASTAIINLSAGDLVVVYFAYLSADGQTPSSELIGTQSLSLARSHLVSSENYRVRVLYKHNCSQEANATFSFSGTYELNYVCCAVAVYSGISTSSAYASSACNDAGCSALAASSTNRTTQNITTTQANSLIVCGGVDWNGSLTHTAQNGYNKRQNGATIFLFDKVASSTGSYPNGNFSTTSASDQYMAITAAFNGA